MCVWGGKEGEETGRMEGWTLNNEEEERISWYRFKTKGKYREEES